MEKQEIREQIWDTLEDSGEARFPFPPHGRIPNFAGADAAAEMLASHEDWKKASSIKSNPDSPQRPVRKRALEAGKVVFMAVPRLADEKCFLKLDPAEIDDIDHATTISGSEELGESIHPQEMERIDLIVSGSVGVTEDGDRIGKGEGYSDLEFAILREFGLVNDSTTTVTTVHPHQIIDAELSLAPHDVSMDIVVTPEEVVRDTASSKPAGINWEDIPEDRLEEIPILRQLN